MSSSKTSGASKLAYLSSKYATDSPYYQDATTMTVESELVSPVTTDIKVGEERKTRKKEEKKKKKKKEKKKDAVKSETMSKTSMTLIRDMDEFDLPSPSNEQQEEEEEPPTVVDQVDSIDYNTNVGDARKRGKNHVDSGAGKNDQERTRRRRKRYDSDVNDSEKEEEEGNLKTRHYRRKRRHDSDEQESQSSSSLVREENGSGGRRRERRRRPNGDTLEEQDHEGRREHDKRRRRHDSDDDNAKDEDEKRVSSPPRRRRRHDSDSDENGLSTPHSTHRQRTRRHDSDDDDGYHDSSRHRHHRKRKKRHDSPSCDIDDDSSLGNSHGRTNRRRRKRHDSDDDSGDDKDYDANQHRRRKHQYRHDSDDDSENNHGSRGRRKDQKRDHHGHHHQQQRIMSSGHRSGLQNASQFREVERKLQHQRREEVRNALQDNKNGGVEEEETVYRDKSGRKIDVHSELAKQQERLTSKALEEEEELIALRKGRVQKELEEAKKREWEQIKSQPFARSIQDDTLERLKKETIRAGDPMAAYAQKKKAQTRISVQQSERPVYKGPAPKPNRYCICPGYRWDGVDRGNGFEDKVLAKQYSSQRRKDDAYRMSSADM